MKTTKHLFAMLWLLIAWPQQPVRSAGPSLDFVEKVLGPPHEGPLPMLIAIHGLGDTPERYSALFADLETPVRLIAPRAPDPFPGGSAWFPREDKRREAGLLPARARLLAEFADELVAARPVRGLPVVTGFSQGGCLSLALAAFYSERFSASLPIAGMLPPALGGFRKAREAFRVIAFHGVGDRRIPLADGERAVRRLQQVGTHASLTVYEGVGHWISNNERRDYHAALREQLEGAR